MYRWLLCFRYLRTRYIALASIISVTLGVATMIVVNSVMAGFSAEMHERLHGLASDILIECHASTGMENPELHIKEIKEVVGDQLAGSSYSVHVPSMLQIDAGGHQIGRHVNLVGLDPETYDSVSEFGKYLLHPENKKSVSFDLRESGYAPDRKDFPPSGAGYRREKLAYEKAIEDERKRIEAIRNPGANTETFRTPSEIENDGAIGPTGIAAQFPTDMIEGSANEPASEKDAEGGFPGIILGISTCTTRYRDADNQVLDHFYARPGDDVRLIFPNAAGKAEKTKVIHQYFTCVDLYESGMSEYDSTFAFVRLDKLQDLRQMVDPITGARSVTTIQLKLVEGADLNAVRDALQKRFPPEYFPYNIQTWRDMQGPLLAAVRLETTILNILLFLIIAVAGFGILSTFFMIVVEKTRDIGTLKSLGASSQGVMSIFLSYGLTLGMVGSGVGLIGGLIFVSNINQVAGWIETITGQEVFDPTVYYFSEIPTIIHPFTLVWVMAGAIGIATMASVLPAVRAARMHPVNALRFE